MHHQSSVQLHRLILSYLFYFIFWMVYQFFLFLLYITIFFNINIHLPQVNFWSCLRIHFICYARLPPALWRIEQAFKLGKCGNQSHCFGSEKMVTFSYLTMNQRILFSRPGSLSCPDLIRSLYCPTGWFQLCKEIRQIHLTTAQDHSRDWSRGSLKRKTYSTLISAIWLFESLWGAG